MVSRKIQVYHSLAAKKISWTAAHLIKWPKYNLLYNLHIPHPNKVQQNALEVRLSGHNNTLYLQTLGTLETKDAKNTCQNPTRKKGENVKIVLPNWIELQKYINVKFNGKSTEIL